MINPCIIGIDGRIEGCVTDSVLERFTESFIEICSIGDGFPPGWTEAVSELAGALEDSLSRWSPAFLSELRTIVKSCRGISSEDFIERISRIQRDLSKYCRSTAVQDEVFSATTKFFEDFGIRYQGSNVQGIAKDECSFEYEGVKIGIKIRSVEDLFKFWMNNGGDKIATVYCGGRRYSIVERDCPPERFAEAIVACVSDDCECDLENESEIGNADISEALMQVAKMLLQR